MTKDRTRAVNALTALARRHNLSIDARKALRNSQILEISRWRARREELSIAVVRSEAIRLAKHVMALDDQLMDNDHQLTKLVQISEAAPLLDEPGFGAISAPKCLTAWPHHGRVGTEAEFASLAGVNPIPASSDNTTRHRLNRGGDRTLNSALHMVAIVKLTHDQETKTYQAKRQADGKSTKEIIRCLKRYLARKIYRHLNQAASSEQRG